MTDATPDLEGHHIDCVLFDLYGTLLDIQVDEDSAPLWRGLSGALAVSGDSVGPAELRRRFQTLLKEEAERGREGFLMELVFQRLMASLGVREEIGRIGRLFRELSLKELILRPYVVPLFEALHRSVSRIGIVSNTEAVLTRYDLDRFPILLTVDAIVLSSEVGVRKPDSRIFRLALERLHSGPESAVFIGNDWTADIAGAQQLGLTAIYITERAADVAPMATRSQGVLEASPTLESILSALRTCGWHEGEP